MVIKTIRGFKDILPREIEKWQFMEKRPGRSSKPSVSRRLKSQSWREALGEKAQLKAFELANQFQLERIKAEIDYEGRNLKAQMRQANKLGARYVLMIGENELETGGAVLRDMERKDQEEIRLNEAVEVVIGRD